MRKIIQIAVESQQESNSWPAFYVVTGLCDDGTVWELEFNSATNKREWNKLPDIPQKD